MSSENDDFFDFINGVPDSKSAKETAKKYMLTIKRELKKISKADSVGQNFDSVYLSTIIIDKECTDKDDPKYRVYSYGTDKFNILDDIIRALQEFIDKKEYHFHYIAKQLNFEIPRVIGEYLNKKYTDKLFWCMKSRYDLETLLDSKKVFDIVILRFDKNGIENKVSFGNTVHPFFEKLKHEWIYGSVNDIEHTLVCYNELFRRAASYSEHFLYLYADIFNSLSALRYENAENKGKILSLDFGRNDSFDEIKKNYNIKLEFKKPISIEEAQYTRIRKLLEISNDRHSLLMNDNGEIFAIGTITENYLCKYYKVSFDGHLHWSLYIGAEKYIEYENMIPKIPDKNKGISNDDIQKYKNTFKVKNTHAIEYIIEEAIKQNHGTMVVFSENAREEAKRLCDSGICINPISLCEEGIVHAITSIDGAIMCDKNGKCFAIGTILDGKASINADSSRGARYNSAIRYRDQQKANNKKTFIVVISEDGYVECFSTND